MRALAMILVAWLVTGCSPAPDESQPLSLLQDDAAPGFARAVAPRTFTFPADHGSHPAFRNEWWYLTGTLADGERSFGFQLTFFRFGLAPGSIDSGWASRQLWLGQLAISDLSQRRFHQAERLSRQALGLAGADSSELDVHIEDWRLQGPLDDLRLVAADDGFGIALSLTALRPIVLQGDDGLSRKGTTPGNASYYYSVPRLAAHGRVTTPDGSWPVEGLAWLDREWSTSALESDQQGWDWFALHLDDGYDLMLYRLRTVERGLHPASAGVLIDPAGQPHHFDAAEITAEGGGWWRSPDTGRSYPLEWRLAGPGFELTVAARMAAQEHTLRFHYWEGAVSARGTHDGRPVAATGYLEMTGYE